MSGDAAGSHDLRLTSADGTRFMAHAGRASAPTGAGMADGRRVSEEPRTGLGAAAGLLPRQGNRMRASRCPVPPWRGFQPPGRHGYNHARWIHLALRRSPGDTASS
jgi:hypothetical protein